MADTITVLDDDETLGLPPAKRRGRPRGSGKRSSSGGTTSFATTQYTVTFAAAFSGISVILAWRLQYPVLLMSKQEAEDIAKPAARIFARSALAKMYGKYVSESNDYFALGMALFSYGSRVWEQSQYLRMAQRGTVGLKTDSSDTRKGESGSNGHVDFRSDESTAADVPTTAGFTADFGHYNAERAD